MVNFNSVFKAFIVILIVSSVNITLAQDEGSISLPSVALKSTIWQQTNIPVCWESSANSYSVEKEWVRSAITETWQKHSGLTFTGWGNCNGSSQGIRIHVGDFRSQSIIGSPINGVKNGMWLNFVHRSFNFVCQNDGYLPRGYDKIDRISSSSEREYCIKGTAIHEFGHALGLTHEQNRVDAVRTDEYWCNPEKQERIGDYHLTPYDRFSIMNYCHPDFSGGGNLSQLDIKAVQLLYPIRGIVVEEDRTNANVQFNLGNKYYSGRGVDQNYETAAYWYKLSADQGNANAQRLLGVLYYNGQGVDQNYETAAYWYKLSADQGNADAQRGLGVLYYTERGVIQNYTTAAYWWKLSADQGNADAQRGLGVLYHNGRGVDQNYETAAYWYKLSADQGNADAKTNLENLLNKDR